MHRSLGSLLRRRPRVDDAAGEVEVEADPDVIARETESVLVAALDDSDDPAQLLTDAAEDAHAAATSGPGIAPIEHDNVTCSRTRTRALAGMGMGVFVFAMALLMRRRRRTRRDR